MKKTLLYGAFALASIALNSSCTQAPRIEKEILSQTITATTPSAQTKIAFTDKGKTGITLAWEQNDSFSVYEPNGKWVADFELSSADLSSFTTTSDSHELVDGTEYVAVYPVRPNGEATYAQYIENDFTASQSATAESLEHLNSSCQMSDSFTWNADAEVNFVHQKAILTVQFDDIPVGETPTEVTFSDGNNKNYTLALSEMKASTGLEGKTEAANRYTVHLMINPSEAIARELTFTVTHTAGVNIYNIPTGKTNDPVAYQAGYRYTAPIMNQNEQQGKNQWLSISTADALKAYLAAPAKNAILTADIDMAGQDITIATLSKIFDGNGHTISNLAITGTADSGTGMFAIIKAGGVVKNLTLTNPTISGKSYMGAIVGKMENNAIVSNCTVVNGNVSGNATIGGIAGNSAGGSIMGCSFAGKVTAKGNNAGGIVGLHKITGTAISVVVDCESDATVTGSTNAGGIVGNATSTAIYNCISSSNVTATGNIAGGVVGLASATPAIYGCQNNGTVIAVSKVGGIAGSYASGGVITACHNLGTVSDATITTSSSAGIIGDVHGEVTLAGCYNYSDFGKEPNNGGIGHIAGNVAKDATFVINDCYFVKLGGTGNSKYGTVCADIATLNEKVADMNTSIDATSYNSYIFVAGVNADTDVPTLIQK